MKRRPNPLPPWIGPTVQFTFGAFIGTMLGISIFVECFAEYDHGWVIIPIAALFIATLAAIFGDRLWMGDSTWRDWKK